MKDKIIRNSTGRKLKKQKQQQTKKVKTGIETMKEDERDSTQKNPQNKNKQGKEDGLKN